MAVKEQVATFASEAPTVPEAAAQAAARFNNDRGQLGEARVISVTQQSGYHPGANETAAGAWSVITVVYVPV
ncbi:MAG TPA: hypothetical protein VFS21_31035 [Roseiflexaceae bacterium]|nr:hypothetical protein [Roseiflexaceae bacterium]